MYKLNNEGENLYTNVKMYIHTHILYIAGISVNNGITHLCLCTRIGKSHGKAVSDLIPEISWSSDLQDCSSYRCKYFHVLQYCSVKDTPSAVLLSRIHAEKCCKILLVDMCKRVELELPMCCVCY